MRHVKTDFFDTSPNRIGSGCLKWDLKREEPGQKSLIPMWVADMDFMSPPEVREAVRLRAEHGIFGYSHRPDSYLQAAADWMEKRFKWRIKKEWMLHTPGIVPALHLAVQAFTAPGEKVIVQTPVYHPFMYAVERNHRKIVFNPLKIESGRYRMDFEDLEKKASGGARLLILCSPHNPVGRVWEREELTALGEICQKNRLIIISDEVHADLVMPGYLHTPTCLLSPEIAGITIACTAPNKTFNIAGLQMANVVISNPELRERFEKTLLAAGLEMANLFGITATEAAYRHGEAWLEALLKYLHGNYLYLREFFQTHLPEITVYPLEGTYLVWTDFRPLGLSDPELKNRLFKKGGVWLSEGSIFGREGAGFQRINIACPRGILEDGLSRIVDALKS